MASPPLARLEGHCVDLGLPAPPVPIEAKFLPGATGWTLLATCDQRHGDAVEVWLRDLPAGPVLRGAVRDRLVLRARLAALPPSCETLLRERRLEHASLRPDGGALLLVAAPPRPAPPRKAAPQPVLTPRQAELLTFCYRHGYYAIPRRTTLRRLGAELGITSASLSLALRRAEAKVMGAHAQQLAEEGAAAKP